MASNAVTFNAESHITIMTRSAGFPGNHLKHAGLISTALGFKDTGVAFSAAKLLIMHRVWKNRLAKILRRKFNLLNAKVAGRAGPYYPETSCTIVASTAGFTFFHLPHGLTIRAALDLEHIGLAFKPTQLINVDGVRECYISSISVFKGENNVNRLAVTTGAVALNAEGG